MHLDAETPTRGTSVSVIDTEFHVMLLVIMMS